MAFALTSLSLPLALWSAAVNREVKSPYLDEVFHVYQAQHYCANRFDVWDPKITTPPGVYLLSYLLQPAFGCSIFALRLSSAIWLAVLTLVLSLSYRLRSSPLASGLQQHAGLNMALFPVIFFLGALYYTDVASTLSVLVFHTAFVHSLRSRTSPLFSFVILVPLGIFSLLFRQTNIFWVAIFPVGVALITSIDQGPAVAKESMHRGVSGLGDSFWSVAKTSWKMQVLYDPPVKDAWFEDYIKMIVSLTCCTLKALVQPKKALNIAGLMAPFLTLLIAFVGFVAWNGGVVLGDKSNHIATLHFPQLLYLWPYMLFFSWPLVLPYLLLIPLSIVAKLSSKTPLESFIMFRRRQALTPRIYPLVLFTCIASVLVYFNTIVHPFTLADNRHYTFYVFRILLRKWWIRYAATPIYILSGWACIQTIGAGPAKPPAVPQKQSSKNNGNAFQTSIIPDGVHSATVSFVLIWLGTSALQLVTAPLVEPRYFILPWLFWRLHLPHQSAAITAPGIFETASGAKRSRRPQSTEHDLRLWLETAWFLLVNAATGYVFLNWGFTWLQEPRSIQRFMW